MEYTYFNLTNQLEGNLMKPPIMDIDHALQLAGRKDFHLHLFTLKEDIKLSVSKDGRRCISYKHSKEAFFTCDN